MCLGELGRVVHTDAALATATVRTVGRDLEVSLLLQPEVRVGDEVLVHTGFVLEVLTASERAAADRLRGEKEPT
ncbi:MAG TPA: HypC/HybG/HupF family hydrogenase formation chaperone [Egicoccus sp.]|nr:HypC/HybG/HupF family hydrogenase formation chaperone [Egicoccus sp.]HSK22192.1 HypC/HybG/HupF family hydrogenase formation chaperone [Egicoccus sp.]